MKKLRSILSALATLRRVPSAAIAEAWKVVKSEAEFRDSADGSPVVPSAALDLIDQIISAVVSLAKDDEDKATKPGKADKPNA